MRLGSGPGTYAALHVGMTQFSATGRIDGTDLEWATKPVLPGWITLYAPAHDGHGARDGLRVLGDFSYTTGSDTPCVANRGGSTCIHPTFTAALAWCGLPVRGLTDDACTIAATFLLDQFAPKRFTDLLAGKPNALWMEGTGPRNLINVVLAVCAELETDAARPDPVLLQEIVTSARNLLTHPDADKWHQ